MSGILAALHLQRHIGMTTTTFPAGKLLSAQRIELAIQALAGAANVSHLAAENETAASLSTGKRQKLGTHWKRPSHKRLVMMMFCFTSL
jgi:hypothetical protein